VVTGAEGITEGVETPPLETGVFVVGDSPPPVGDTTSELCETLGDTTGVDVVDAWPPPPVGDTTGELCETLGDTTGETTGDVPPEVSTYSPSPESSLRLV
jgi:hypothetical protein